MMKTMIAFGCAWLLALGGSVVADETNTAKPESPKEPNAKATSSQKETDSEEQQTRTLGIVLYDRFELLDVAGPAEIFGNVGSRLKIVMIADKAGPVRSTQGIAMVADVGYDEAPPLDLVLVPGGIGTLRMLGNKPLLEWLKSRAEQAEIVMSVCSGSGILAKAGLLDGRQATTNKQSYRLITAWDPDVKWVKEARWVDDGNIVTSSGVSAGMDMALHVVQRLYGEKVAQQIADGTEYEWHRDSTWDPFAKFAK